MAVVPGLEPPTIITINTIVSIVTPWSFPSLTRAENLKQWTDPAISQPASIPRKTAESLFISIDVFL